LKGKFTDPNITLEQMTEKVAGFATAQMGVPEAQARSMAKANLSNLKRWKKKI
jgi:hypothetical protein